LIASSPERVACDSLGTAHGLDVLVGSAFDYRASRQLRLRVCHGRPRPLSATT
jgi:hypothetical protein